MNNPAELAAVLANRHAEAHDLLERIAAIVDSIDPDTADWGHAGSLGSIVERLHAIAEDFEVAA